MHKIERAKNEIYQCINSPYVASSKSNGVVYPLKQVGTRVLTSSLIELSPYILGSRQSIIKVDLRKQSLLKFQK